MLETIRKYWIGLLVIVLVGLHASIVGMIRYQASLAKIDVSCEVDLGQYLAYRTGKKSPLQMHIHAVVPLNHRMKSRQVIELNQAQIRQALEEHLRQLDGKVLTDPYLADLKQQLLEVMIQTIGDSSIDDLVVTELRELSNDGGLEFVSQGTPHHSPRLVATLRGNEEVEDKHSEEVSSEDVDAIAEEEAQEAEAAEAKAKAAEAAQPKSDDHGSHGAHGAPAKKSSGHGASSGSHGGHGADKAPAKKSGH